LKSFEFTWRPDQIVVVIAVIGASPIFSDKEFSKSPQFPLVLARFSDSLAYNGVMAAEHPEDTAKNRDLPIPKAAGRVLAIDYGRKRIGLAISDPLRFTAGPLMVFSRTNRQEDIRRLRQLCREHEVRRILVGYPLSIDGSKSEMAEEAARFALRVEKHLGIPVELVDERLTSWEATQISSSLTESKAAARRSLDDIAAAVILREYLERRRAEVIAAVSISEEG
jgi:putative Holliday junction resolvase